jgi:methylmalonyl-CoA/ethylmalonyl-CoA epimerase
MSLSTIGITRLGQVAIPARDIRRAVDFYRNTLGLRLLFEAPPKLAFFDCGGVRLMLSEPEPGEGSDAAEGGEFHPGSVLYYAVDDLNRAHTQLIGRGVQVESPPHLIARMPDHELWMAFFRDSEGNLVALMSEVRS